MNDHYLYLCADERVVRSIKLSGIKNLPKRFNGSEGKEFVYGAYLKGEYLDENVKSDRSDFNIVDDPDGFIDEITYRDIISEVQYKCSNYLKPLTDIIAQEKEQRVNSFIQNEGVFYRPIINHLKDSIERVEPDATNSDMDRELYKGYLQLLEKTHIETDELFKQNEDGNEIEEYEGQFEEVFNNISDLHKTDLARYVLHRKVVLKFLKIQLSRVEGKKYKTEDRIHNIIFPMGKTSDDIPFDKHNLWIIDERLAFHTYLASDKPLSNTVGGSTSKKRPDIIIFDKAHAFTEGNNAPYSSITIIEFKRPQRKDYSEKENPITQVYDYIDDIKNRRKQTIDGRPISIGENIPFYCYIICDITSNLVRWAEAAAFYKTPDQIGYFGYNPNKHAYVEVISYNKLVNDSEKRNKAFFDKLNLPSGQ
ncbi:MAG: hypothetical protein NTW26_06930 [bacterium]|nr:hypothetical protein [bacterium]